MIFYTVVTIVALSLPTCKTRDFSGWERQMSLVDESGMLPAERLTKAIVSFAAEAPASAVPRAASESAKKLVLNTIGVMLGAANRQIGKIIAQYVAEMARRLPQPRSSAPD